MPSFSLDADFDGRKFRNSQGRFVKRDSEVFRKAVRHAARKGAQHARAEAPKKSGALAKSIKGSSTGNNARIRSNSPYARVLEEGAPSLSITGYMRFFWEGQGRMFTGPPSRNYPNNPPENAGYPWPATVTRPPFKGRHFMRDGLRVAEKEMVDYLRRNL